MVSGCVVIVWYVVVILVVMLVVMLVLLYGWDGRKEREGSKQQVRYAHVCVCVCQVGKVWARERADADVRLRREESRGDRMQTADNNTPYYDYYHRSQPSRARYTRERERERDCTSDVRQG